MLYVRPDLCVIAATPGILAEMFNARPDFTIIAAEKISNLLNRLAQRRRLEFRRPLEKYWADRFGLPNEGR